MLVVLPITVCADILLTIKCVNAEGPDKYVNAALSVVIQYITCGKTLDSDLVNDHSFKIHMIIVLTCFTRVSLFANNIYTTQCIIDHLRHACLHSVHLLLFLN